jgi:hypothetical protein
VSVWAWMHPTGLWMHNVWLRCTCCSGACSASLCTAATAVHCVSRTQHTRSIMAFELGHGRPASKHRVTPESLHLTAPPRGLPHCAACAAARSEVAKATAPPQHTCLSTRWFRPEATAPQWCRCSTAASHGSCTHTHTALQLLHSAHAARHSRIRYMASYLPIPWCFKASRDCTAHGDAPQTRVRQQIQKRHTQPANPYDCTRSQDTRTHGRSVHDTTTRSSTGRAANDTRQRRGTHRRKHSKAAAALQLLSDDKAPTVPHTYKR